VDTPGKLELTTYLNRVMFPYILLVSVSALAMGMLNSFDRFAAPAFAPVLFNVSIIAFSFVTGWFSDPETALAIGVVVGGLAQIVCASRSAPISLTGCF
jgi:putative peptidoglycan lipid II flippase